MKARPCPAGSWALNLDIWPQSPPWSLYSVSKRPLASARPAVPPESLPGGPWDGRVIGHKGAVAGLPGTRSLNQAPTCGDRDQAFAPHPPRPSTRKALESVRVRCEPQARMGSGKSGQGQPGTHSLSLGAGSHTQPIGEDPQVSEAGMTWVLAARWGWGGLCFISTCPGPCWGQGEAPVTGPAALTPALPFLHEGGPCPAGARPPARATHYLAESLS